MYVIRESFRQAFQQLMTNKLRSFLSLLGIMIGIFCIIAVKSAVDSLEDNVRRSFSKLGNDVIYISKMPWNENPDENFWKYSRRPNPSLTDFRNLSEHLTTAKSVVYSLFINFTTLKYRKNTVERAFGVAVTDDYDNFHSLEYEAGRFFSAQEYQSGANRIILGYKVAKELFGDEGDPIGKEVKVFGRNMIVVGVLKESGKDLVKIYNYDNIAMIGFELARSIVNVKPNRMFAGNLQVKAAEGVSEAELKDDIIVSLRKTRHIKPSEKDNFSMNSMTMFAEPLNAVFSTLNAVGFIIGGFALLVGIFSVANIMFVSVKERTNIIGIKKALGAKQGIILLEFLIESIVLCLLGGLMGLVLVWGVLKLVSIISLFEMYVSFKNVITTLLVAVIAGVISGFIPALQASRMDPVEAIRS
ncbi:MAG: ABC transporter permease [Saprospiraceae bacterium]|nr:ABC transporter permease [Saprospiraceae bacterium]